ncbi:hypothetical protein K6755_00485 [Faecalibacterium prausnitzii]
MKKRLISLLVALCMAVTLLPVSAITAWAEESGSNLKPLQFRQGYPVITDDMPSKTDSKGHTIYTGDGWSYDGTDKVLTLAPENPTTYDLKDYGSIRKDYNSIACSTIIKKNATIVNGSFLDIKNPGSSITNHGTITSGTYSMPVINHGTITGGIFRKKPTGGNVDNGYTLNVNSQQNGSHESFYAEIKDLGSSVYVIPNSYYNTSVTILYGFFDSWPETLFPIDVTFGNTNDTHCLLKDWAPSARYHYNADHVYVTFTAPPANAGTVTLSKLTRLVIDKDGYPVGTKGGTQDYSGNGWRFEKSNKTLTLESGDYSFWEQSEVNCPVIIKDGVTTIGGMFSKKVTNYGTVEKAVINNIFENRNTVKNSYFFNSSSSIAVTNHGGTMLDCLFENAPEGIESHTITEVEDYFISAELDGIAYQAIQTKFYFTGTPKLRVNLVKDGNVKPVTSINQKLNYGGLIEDYPVGYIFTVENDNEDVVLNAAPVPGKDDPKPEPKPEPEAPTYTLTVKGGTFTYNGGEAMTSANVPVDAEVKVTLNQSAVPEGMVFDLWAMDEASLLGNPAVAYNEESFTIPAGSVAKGSIVTVEAQYRDATIESEPSVLGTAAIIGVAGAGTAVIVWQGYRIGMELYEKYFQPTPEETAVVEPTLEGQMTDPIS